jgi:hypothetical protein
MRDWGAIAAASLAVLAAAGPAAADSPPHRRCADAEGPYPRDIVRFGPAFTGTTDGYVADPDAFAQQYDPDRDRYAAKIPMGMRRGVTATVSIARADRPFANFVSHGRNAGDVVRMTACPRSDPEGEGVRNRYTAWAWGYFLKEPRCVDVVVRRGHPRRVHRTTLSFGMGDTC